MAPGVEAKHDVGVAAKRGGAVSKGRNVKNVDLLAVGGDGDPVGGVLRTQKPEVCDLVQLAN